MPQLPPVPPTLLIACPADAALDHLVGVARAHGAVVARTHDPDQAQRWLHVLQPDLLVAEPPHLARLQTLPLGPACQPLPWQGEVQGLRHALSRWIPELAEPMPLLRVGVLCIDEARCLVGRALDAGRTLQTPLPPVELRLLLCLARQPGRLITREELQERVWPHDAQPQPRTVDQVVRRLRKVLATVGLAQTVRSQRGLGYQFDPAAPATAPFPVQT